MTVEVRRKNRKSRVMKALSLNLLVALVAGCGHEEPRIRSESDELRGAPQLCGASTISKIPKADTKTNKCNN
jgi:hypothetical protein